MPTPGLRHVTQLEDCFPSEMRLPPCGPGQGMKQESWRPAVITHHPDSCRASRSEWCPVEATSGAWGMEPPMWCCM